MKPSIYPKPADCCEGYQAQEGKTIPRELSFVENKVEVLDKMMCELEGRIESILLPRACNPSKLLDHPPSQSSSLAERIKSVSVQLDRVTGRINDLLSALDL